MSWTDERVDQLKKMWSEGLTASQIAAKLGGVSRNAVIGKVHRLKLESRAQSPKSTSGRKPAAPRAAAAAPRVGSGAGTRTTSRGGSGGSSSLGGGAPRTMSTVTQTVGATVMKAEVEGQTLAELDTRPIEDVVVPIARKLKLTEINEKTCKFPYGDPLTDDFYFCGHDIHEETPYCNYHGKVVYQQPHERKRRV
ncbi:MAG: GcrA family cell cycle regulator [Ahrensia sp.]